MYMNLSEYYNQIGDVLLNTDKDYANATSYTDVLPKSSMLSPYQPTGMSVVTGGTRPNYKALPGEFTDTHFDNKWVTDPKGAGAPEGGKVNRLKKAQRWSGFAKDTVGDGFEIYDKVMKYMWSPIPSTSETSNLLSLDFHTESNAGPNMVARPEHK